MSQEVKNISTSEVGAFFLAKRERIRNNSLWGSAPNPVLAGSRWSEQTIKQEDRVEVRESRVQMNALRAPLIPGKGKLLIEDFL